MYERFSNACECSVRHSFCEVTNVQNSSIIISFLNFKIHASFMQVVEVLASGYSVNFHTASDITFETLPKILIIFSIFKS